jgi:hypothetical protein
MWLCCFCGGEIDERSPDPCRITVTTAENEILRHASAPSM